MSWFCQIAWRSDVSVRAQTYGLFVDVSSFFLYYSGEKLWPRTILIPSLWTVTVCLYGGTVMDWWHHPLQFNLSFVQHILQANSCTLWFRLCFLNGWATLGLFLGHTWPAGRCLTRKINDSYHVCCFKKILRSWFNRTKFNYGSIKRSVGSWNSIEEEKKNSPEKKCQCKNVEQRLIFHCVFVVHHKHFVFLWINDAVFSDIHNTHRQEVKSKWKQSFLTTFLFYIITECLTVSLWDRHQRSRPHWDLSFFQKDLFLVSLYIYL